MNATQPSLRQGVRALPADDHPVQAAGEGTGGEKSSSAARPLSPPTILFSTIEASTNFFCSWVLWSWRWSLWWWG
jgi:hypothetical protein